MQYVAVSIAGSEFHGSGPLTYASDQPLLAGCIVEVPLKNKKVLGVVMSAAKLPNFSVKKVLREMPAPPIPGPMRALHEWMATYYPAPLGQTTQLFLPKKFPKLAQSQQENAAKQEPARDLPPLTNEQQAALEALHAPGMHILHGETGSGKTRVYIELARRNFAQGRSAIILTPEIGLTSQLEHSFNAIFKGHVITLHSRLTESQRATAWLTIAASKHALVVVGARSALFSPLQNIGLIVLDESHETSYKQDQSPHYQTSSVAAKLAQLHEATLVLGSATPLVSDYYIAQAKRRPIIRMYTTAAGAARPPKVQVIDLRLRTNFTKSAILSDALVEAVQQRLERQEQSLLFLNRRGTARTVLCEQCGWQALCPHCDVPLVYHGDQHLLRCHSCDHRAAVAASCPSCGHASILFKSIGTKAVLQEVQRLFPNARSMRFDTDNTKDERLEHNITQIQKGETDILIGTQAIAKGLDLPKLGLVGAVLADTSLYFPDFSAQERTYQLLSQVLGRVGRGHRDGNIIIQTYDPNSELLKAIVQKDWPTFYKKELAERRAFGFPPFNYLLKLTCERASGESAQHAAAKLCQNLQQRSGVIIEGPAPCFHEKTRGKFKWQIIVKSKRRNTLLELLRELPNGWLYDIDPVNLL